MYFLFTTVLTASFLIKSEVTAVTFVGEVLLTAIYLRLFSIYFCNNRKIVVFVPLMLISVSLHMAFFLMELTKSYIKNINIWILAVLLIALCCYIAFGTSSNSGITAVTHMCIPIFFVLLFLALVNLLTGNAVNSPIAGKSIYQYFLSIVSPPSVALSLTYMHKCTLKQIFPAFMSALTIAVFFFLIDSPFFRAIALNFIAPVLISVELLVIKEAVLPRKDMLDKSNNTQS